jgi:lysophospholipase L1-like esterase
VSPVLTGAGPRVAAVLMTVLMTALAAAGCRADGDAGDADGHDRYVAIGDSFTSGAGLPETHLETGVCGQSSLNYPHLVAKKIGAKLVDASCGGASTDNGTQPQARGDSLPPWPPQLDSLTKDTDLVTVGLGANDFAWYMGVMFTCTSAAALDPTGDPCEQQAGSPGSNLTALPAQIGPRLEALLTQVHQKAPKARVLLVGYPQPVPASGACPDLPLAAGDYPFVRAQWEAMDQAMRGAADAADATFVDVMGPSDGHDVCAGADAWVSGLVPPAGVAAPYHPLREGQAAIAELVEKALQD